MRSFLAVAMLCFGASVAPASEVMVGMASVDSGRITRFDGGHYHGVVATGARFKSTIMAVAHRTLPLHSCVKVEYRGRSQVAEVNDRGPCATDHCRRIAPERVKNRILDMTPAVATRLSFPGLGRVSFWRVSCES